MLCDRKPGCSIVRNHAVQDQRRALQEMCQAAFGDQAPAVDVYDGDTAKVGFEGSRTRRKVVITGDPRCCVTTADQAQPKEVNGFSRKACKEFALIFVSDAYQGVRGETRDRAQLLITNPDMLHCSVLPVHRQFSRILAHLRYVIVDEGHAYRCVSLPINLPP